MSLFRTPSQSYLSEAYYKALLAEARGERWPISTAAMCDRWVPTTTALHVGGRGLAILHDPFEMFSPGDDASTEHALTLAHANGLPAEVIAPHLLEDLVKFDALWIRMLTTPTNVAYHYARQAELLDMPVIDSPQAIRHCSNKAFLAERLRRAGIPTPSTILAPAGMPLDKIEGSLPYPIIVKDPDGSFSAGVFKAENCESLEKLLEAVWCTSHLAVLQAFVPTAFDWRITLLDGEFLFACKYQMAPGHWQILKHEDGKAPSEGGFSAVERADVPAPVLHLARRAAGVMGAGLYGVDIKETADAVFVIEVNDNPNINHGTEDLVEGDAPWLKILSWFGRKIMLKQLTAHHSRLTVGDKLQRFAATA